MNYKELRASLLTGNMKAVELINADSYEENSIIELVNNYGYRLFQLEGSTIRTKAELINRIAEGMEFPSYFGYNWDALDECIRDLDWLPAKGYVLLFTNSEDFIENSPSEFRIFLEIISSASIYWTDQKVRFLLILVVENNMRSYVKSLIEST